ncbi:hypothetical protein V5799_008252 [Amblyomma americanum]|uniref:Uncharacterized protein n=1 Tax=Amblyomma americanum TaxID=6943 RepID=A0AAQ4FEZ6_AMBAM
MSKCNKVAVLSSTLCHCVPARTSSLSNAFVVVLRFFSCAVLWLLRWSVIRYRDSHLLASGCGAAGARRRPEVPISRSAVGCMWCSFSSALVSSLPSTVSARAVEEVTPRCVAQGICSSYLQRTVLP